jgi:GWxTD domain-containing protein
MDPMKKSYYYVFPLLIICLITALPAQKKRSLPQKHKKWIEEDAVYIITSKEREVFYKLETDKERDMFIELFWKQRDPSPGTPRNEFREEHYSRIEYANKEFKKYTSVEGWRTDRGRIYIILGEPIHVEKYHRTEAHPIEIWQYYGNPKFGQAPVFRLLFFRRYGIGPFELYNPIADGPKALTPLSSMRLPSASGGRSRGIPAQWSQIVTDPRDLAAWEILRDEVAFEVADAAWSAFPGSGTPEQMIPTSALIGEVQQYPQKKVEDDYAYEFLEHKGIVEVDYSVNYIQSLSRIQVIEGQPGLFFVNYSIEPEALSVDHYKGKYSTIIRISVRVTDLEGKTIVQHSREFPLDLEKKQFKNIGIRPFHIYDSFPLVPGNYRLDILWENTVSKEFTSAELDISIPDPEFLRMTPLVMCRKINPDASQKEFSRPFQVENLQIYPSLRKIFSRSEPLYVFFQIIGLDQKLIETGQIDFSLLVEERTVPLLSRKIREFSSNRNFLQEFSLEKFPPGDYRLKVTLSDDAGEMFSEVEDFSVLESMLPEPWVVSQTNPSAGDPVYSFIMGNQFYNRGDLERARVHLEKAFQARPGSMDFALNYARVLFLYGEFQETIRILQPFSQSQQQNFSLYYYLGRSSEELGEYSDAITNYQKALAHKGNVIQILNAIGNCHMLLGEKEQALRAWEKSLEINPEQERIKAAVEEIKKKN